MDLDRATADTAAHGNAGWCDGLGRAMPRRRIPELWDDGRRTYLQHYNSTRLLSLLRNMRQ